MKKSAEIRKHIGSLIYEQSLYSIEGNDAAIDRLEDKISALRCELIKVEEKEKNENNELEALDEP